MITKSITDYDEIVMQEQSERIVTSLFGVTFDLSERKQIADHIFERLAATEEETYGNFSSDSWNYL